MTTTEDLDERAPESLEGQDWAPTTGTVRPARAKRGRPARVETPTGLTFPSAFEAETLAVELDVRADEVDSDDDRAAHVKAEFLREVARRVRALHGS